MIGQHGAKKVEQQRLGIKYSTPVSGKTHESEHVLGYKVLAPVLPRGESGEARDIENRAPAYQEVKSAHKAHIGTGYGREKDESGFTDKTYRETQRSLLEIGDIGSAIQINQLGYAFRPEFHSTTRTIEGKVADDSFHEMVRNLREVPFRKDDTTFDLEVSQVHQIEAELSRIAVRTGKFPDEEVEKSVYKKYGRQWNPQTQDDPMQF